MATPPNFATSNNQQLTVTRDAMPLPDAARRVIRNQRGGDINNLRGTQASSARSTGLILTPQMQQAHGSLGSSHRLPTLQEMYNTWRSLEQQISQMRRLPMFVKAELKFCHGCRILKIRCTCFDYSQLEAAYQEKDRILRDTALRDFPVEGNESDEDNAVNAGAAPSGQAMASPSTATAVFGTPITPATAYQHSPTDSDITQVVPNWSPVETYQPSIYRSSHLSYAVDDHMMAIDPTLYGSPVIQASGFDFNATPARTIVNPAIRIDTATASAAHSHARQSTPIPASAVTPVSTTTPTLLKFELRTIIMAKEKIGLQSRRWQCQYGLSDNPADPVCKREDENMETIRRHYGREHGSHRYHKKPTIRIRCSHCNTEYDKLRPPIKCPGCKVDRGIWLREIFAVIEVPVPLNSRDNNGSSSGSGDTGSGTGGASGFGGFGRSGGPADSGSSGTNSTTIPRGAEGFGSVRSSGISESPGGFHESARHQAVLSHSRRSDSPVVNTVKIDPTTNMPECYNDICNNTTAVAVMPPPGISATETRIQPERPSSSSSSTTTRSHSMASSRTLSSHSPFTQGFYAVGRGVPLPTPANMAHVTTPSMSPGTPMSPPSPASITSSAQGSEAMAVRPYDPLGVASGQSRVRFADQLATEDGFVDGGPVGGPVGGDIGGDSGAHARVFPSPPVESYTDLLDIPASPDPIEARVPVYSTAPELGPQDTVSMADVQMFIDMAAARASSTIQPTCGNAASNNSCLPKGKCTTESEIFYFAD